MRYLVRTLGLLLAVPVLAVLPSSAGADDPDVDHGGDVFYAAPGVLPPKPGDLARYQATTFYAGPLLPSGAKAWKVLYRSTTAQGRGVAVSGLVVVPRKAWQGPGPRPVVSYSPGTTGMGDRCAVSKSVTVPFADPVTSYEAPFIAMLLAKGWAVAVTDYQGLGTAGEHPYVVGNALGRNALDVVRAAQRLQAAGLSRSAPVLIWGYSEGGNGAGWAAQLASTYAPELKVKAAAFGGVPNDLLAMFPTLENGPLAALIAMAAIGLDTSYPDLDLDRYLNDRGRTYLPLIARSCLSDGLPLGAFQRTSRYTTSNPIDDPEWRGRIAQNTLSNRRPPAFPLYLYHGTLDEAVAYNQDRALRSAWCARGAEVRWQSIVAEHLTAYAFLAPSAATFLQRQLAHKNVPTNC